MPPQNTQKTTCVHNQKWVEEWVTAGSSAVGQRVVKRLAVTSSSPEVLPLSTDLLSSEGTFSLVNAVRPLQAEGVSHLSVAFLPQVCWCPQLFSC